jgi:predicted nucleic acid-binding protein
VLVDVDVILDVLARREPFFAESAAVLAASETGRCRGVVAARTITTLWYLLAKYHDRAHAREKTAGLLKILEVATVDRQVIDAALVLDIADFEDAVQACAAAEAAADYVVTRNLADFSRGPVPAVSPAELLPLLPEPGR